MTELGKRILAMQDITSEVVTIPEWGDLKIEVRSMNGTERAIMLRDCWDPELERMDTERMLPYIVIGCSFDPETGEKLFSPADSTALQQKNAKALQRIQDAGMRLSGLNEREEEKRAESFPDGASGGA